MRMKTKGKREGERRGKEGKEREEVGGDILGSV